MRLFIIALRDIRADCYGQPAFVTNLGAAIRTFGDQIKDPAAGDLHKHPEDFELFHIGFYNDQIGELEPLTNQIQIATGAQYK